MTYVCEQRFWDFMIERELIRMRRLRGEPPQEWTKDPIFKQFSFTNIKRHHDRTTALLIKEFYEERYPMRHPSPEALLNATIYRYFGTIETARAIGWKTTWNAADRADAALSCATRMVLRDRVFTPAYIVPSCGLPGPKHDIVIDIVRRVFEDADRILASDSWEVVTDNMCWILGVGQFMAKEVLLDYILVTGWTPSDWTTWTPIGPGGRRGAGVVRDDMVYSISTVEALDVCRQLYERRFQYWPPDMVELDLTDIQFQLCEFAKYEKARRGVGRPKRTFRPTIDAVTKEDMR